MPGRRLEFKDSLFNIEFYYRIRKMLKQIGRWDGIIYEARINILIFGMILLNRYFQLQNLVRTE